MSAVSSMDVNSSVVFFYPRLFPIHDVNPSETGVPDPIRTSMEKIRDDGVYVLDGGLATAIARERPQLQVEGQPLWSCGLK